jgi:hypothetical protein
MKIKPRMAAVMMLFYPKNGMTHLVLIVLELVHSGQIAFPGGETKREFFCDSFAKHMREVEPPGSNGIIKFYAYLYPPTLWFIRKMRFVLYLIPLKFPVLLNCHYPSFER